MTGTHGLFYFMKITKIPFERKQNISAVYKITFDDYWFYIGSSLNFRARQSSWVTKFTIQKFLKSLNIKAILHDKSVIKFEIIHECKKLYKLREIETKYIQASWQDERLLNRCPDSKTPKGIRRQIGYIEPVIRPKIDTRKKVAVFDLNDNLIKICESYMSFSREFKIKSEFINKILRGERSQFKKFKIKSVTKDGDFVEPITYIKPKGVSQDMSHKWKIIHQIDESGKVVAVHNHFRAAAKALGCSDRYVHMLLKNKGRGRKAKGYYLKYA